MVIHRGYEGFHPVKPVVTVGVFDGVHRGHNALLETVVSKAKETGGESVVITFSSHPRKVLGKESVELSYITTPSEKTNLLERMNIDHLVILDFNIEFSRTGACDFVRNVIVKKIGAKYLIFGYDHRIGREGEGDYNTIRQCSGISDLIVEQGKGVFSGEVAISSSAIREALLDGNLDVANELLGYPYQLGGTVVPGRKIGRSFGFPTANIKPDNQKLVPAKGVYAVEVLLEKKVYKGMLSIGTNPTVNPHSSVRSIEVHIIGFDENIYGRKISVRFRKRLRDEKKFPDIDTLTRQMHADKQETIRVLS
ncbi:MAG TPA: bifunctional riboflavin kinase/FAD synthetase [Bacteroidales bacterium]|nr:bifunctional riboflavin kinase/FAD synthetase [Bacteroidales bacterium]